MRVSKHNALLVLGVVALNSESGISGQSPLKSDSAQVRTLSVPDAMNSSPSLAASGRSVAVVWTAAKSGSTNVYLATSSDGGVTFSAPRRVNDQDGDAGATNEQPPRVAISGAAGSSTLTVVWSKRDPGPQQTRQDTVRMARSTDGGRTFSPARFLHDAALGGARGWESLVPGAEFTVHALWLDGRNAATKMAETAKHTEAAHKGQPPQEIYHARISTDGRTVETLVASDVCFCCKTALAVGPRSAVYAAWRHIFPGSMRDIAFATSNDDGRSFAPFVRVSADNWELNGCPEDGPSIGVEESGKIHIAWATVVGQGSGQQKAVFYATSNDGKSFSPRVRLPAAADSTPGHPQLVLTTNGGAAIVFDEVMTGVRRVSVARVSRDGRIQPPQVLSGEESASHPVIVPTANDLVIAWTSRSDAPSSRSTIRLTRVKRM